MNGMQLLAPLGLLALLRFQSQSNLALKDCLLSHATPPLPQFAAALLSQHSRSGHL